MSFHSRNARRITAAVSATALLGAAGVGAASAATSTSGDSSSSTPAKRAGQPPRRGPSSADVSAIAAKLGISSTQLKAAMAANRPPKPAGDKAARGPAAMAASLATALGVDASDVRTILEANRPPRPTGGVRPTSPPPKPDHTKVIAALASGLKLDEATVTAAFDKLDAAHKADHDARHAAEYAGIAKTLGLSADDVKAAFEAVLPAPPAK